MWEGFFSFSFYFIIYVVPAYVISSHNNSDFFIVNNTLK